MEFEEHKGEMDLTVITPVSFVQDEFQTKIQVRAANTEIVKNLGTFDCQVSSITEQQLQQSLKMG